MFYLKKKSIRHRVASQNLKLCLNDKCLATKLIIKNVFPNIFTEGNLRREWYLHLFVIHKYKMYHKFIYLF